MVHPGLRLFWRVLAVLCLWRAPRKAGTWLIFSPLPVLAQAQEAELAPASAPAHPQEPAPGVATNTEVKATSKPEDCPPPAATPEL